ncbi:MAG: winged helix-turn-helix domain-containing protein [Nitrososphaerota archaeon]|nr:winged helix-turn-helix domain-containing protein [Candidatus Bathyarchaeota archaeon]MDW8023647.1 winged helix-turn-helix domain-containing protein [Nitrososphaerota archaeon]
MPLRRSRLETYEAILEVLARRPLKVDTIAYRSGVECTALWRYLNFLLENGLVEERFFGGRRLYALTDRGRAVFRTLNSKRRLEKIAKSLKAVSEVLKAAPTVPKSEDEKKYESEAK